MQLRNSVRRHGEVHLGRAPGALVTHEAAVQGVVEVVGLGHVQHDFAWHGMILLDFGMT